MEDLVYVKENKVTKRQFLVEGDILITASTGSIKVIGKNAFVENDLNASFGAFCKVVRPKKIDSLYLKHMFQSPQYFAYIQNVVNGANINNIKNEHIDNFQIPLPPLETQKHIAQILDDAAALRDKTAQLIKEYDALAQSIFWDMFGDPVKNEMGWEVNILKQISSKIHSGNTPKGGSEVYVEEGITFFRSQNVWKNKIVYEDVAYIDQATHKKMIKSSLKHKDILMTKTGRINTENSSLGRAAMYLGEDDDANVNGHVYLIRLKKGIINEFVLHILTTKEYRGLIRRVCVGGIDKRQLNKDHLENFPIINPPKELQNQFAEKIALIEQQKELAKQELKESKDLFNCLLQKAFRGELT